VLLITSSRVPAILPTRLARGEINQTTNGSDDRFIDKDGG
jgi:hypothetical protein